MSTQYKVEHHQFRTGVKVGHLQYCLSCGLICMKNEFTEWALKQGCNHREHPSYKNKLGITNPFKD